MCEERAKFSDMVMILAKHELQYKMSFLKKQKTTNKKRNKNEYNLTEAAAVLKEHFKYEPTKSIIYRCINSMHTIFNTIPSDCSSTFLLDYLNQHEYIKRKVIIVDGETMKNIIIENAKKDHDWCTKAMQKEQWKKQVEFDANEKKKKQLNSSYRVQTFIPTNMKPFNSEAVDTSMIVTGHKYLYGWILALNYTINQFKHLNPLYCADFSHHYENQGTLFSVVTLSPNNRIIILCVGHFIGNETSNTWNYVMEFLQELFPNISTLPGTLLCDMKRREEYLPR